MGRIKRALGLEKRESQPFTDAVVSALFAQASGDSLIDPSALGALEIAASAWARALASAEVKPKILATAGVTPEVLALVARTLIRRGEIIFELEVKNGKLKLNPVGSHSVSGGPDPSSWFYKLDRFGPSGNVTLLRPANGVLHFRYSVDPARPWHGIGPLGWSADTARLAAGLERRLGQEANMPVGGLLPIPVDGGDGSKDDPLAMLKKELKSLKGEFAMLETTSSGFGEGRAAAPQTDWQPRRLGANFPPSLPMLRSDAGVTVLSACGVPAILFSEKGEGSGAREGWRRFLFGSVRPVAALIQQELREKLEVPDLELSFEGLFASDLVSRARSFGSMVQAGMDLEKAAALSGLVVPGDDDD